MTRREGFKKDGKCYVWCQDHYEEVSEAVYHVIMDEPWREEKRKQRSWRCRDGQGFRCTGDCEQCELYRLGEGPTGSDASLDQMYEESDYEPGSETDEEETTIRKLMISAAIDELSKQIPDAGRIAEMLMNGDLEKDVADELGIAKTTLNYRKNKLIKLLRERLIDLI